MSSGFGTFDGPAVTISGNVGGLVTAVVSQSVNASDRTVTVTVTAYAGYQRVSGGSWTMSAGQSLWRTDHSDAYLEANVDGSTNALWRMIGVESARSQTVYNGTNLTVPNGGARAASGGYGIEITASKTFNYDNNGSAISRSWSCHLHQYHSSAGWHDMYVSGSFTTDSISPAGNPPSQLSVTNLSTTWNTVTGTFSVGDWGGTSPAYIATRVMKADGSAGYIENQFNGESSVTTTITNNSTPLGGGLTMQGCGTYAVDVYAQNTYGSTNSNDITVYTAPAPGQITYTELGSSPLPRSTVTFVGDLAKTFSNYDPTQLTRTVREQSSASPDTWHYIENDAVVPVDTPTTFSSLPIPPGESLTVEAWMTYRGIQSEVSTVTIVNNTDPVHIYGSVNNEAIKTDLWYGSVDNQSVRITKIYGSHEMVARRVYECPIGYMSDIFGGTASPVSSDSLKDLRDWLITMGASDCVGRNVTITVVPCEPDPEELPVPGSYGKVIAPDTSSVFFGPSHPSSEFFTFSQDDPSTPVTFKITWCYD